MTKDLFGNYTYQETKQNIESRKIAEQVTFTNSHEIAYYLSTENTVAAQALLAELKYYLKGK